MRIEKPAANATICPRCMCKFVVEEKRHDSQFYERVNPNYCPNCGSAFWYGYGVGMTAPSYSRTVKLVSAE